MDNNVSFGSGSGLLGAPASAILGMPGTLAQSPSSAGFTPGALPPPPMSAPPTPQSFQSPAQQPIPGSAPVPSSMPIVPQAPLGQPAQAPNVMGQPQSSSESQMIIKALASRLASVSKGEEMARGQQ